MDLSSKFSLLGFFLLFLFVLNTWQDNFTDKGVSITNTKVEKLDGNSCRYTLVRKNNNLKDQILKIHVNLLTKKGQADHFDWEDNTLIAENPRIDYILANTCPSYVLQNGATGIEYIVSDSDKIIEKKTIDVSTEYSDSSKSSK